MQQKPKWRVLPSDGPHLAEALNDLTDDGYYVHSMFHIGNGMQESRLIEGQKTLVPMLLVVAEYRGE